MNINPLSSFDPSQKITPLPYTLTHHNQDYLNFNISHSDIKIFNFSLMKAYLGYDILLTRFYNELTLDEIESLHIIKQLEEMTLNTPKIENNKNSSSTIITKLETIAQTHYLTSIISSEDIYKFLLQFFTSLSKEAKEKELLTLLIANCESSDALESFLDNMFATKGTLSKDKRMYEKSVDDIMNIPLSKLFCVFSILAIEPLFHSQSWQLKFSRKHLENYIHSNIIELIIYEMILNELLPVGHTRFSVTFDSSNNNRQEFVLNMKLFHFQKNIYNFKIIYNASQHTCEIFNKISLRHSKPTTSL
jgi:hypothetical protein